MAEDPRRWSVSARKVFLRVGLLSSPQSLRMRGVLRESAPVNSHEERDEAMKSLMIATVVLMTTSAVARAQDKVEVPKEALQEMAFLVGEWEAKGTFNDKEISGTYSAQWAPGKHCLRLAIHWKDATSSHASGIGGWSPDQKQYVEYWFTSDGDFRTFWYSLGEEKGVWVGTFTAADKAGKKSSGKIRLEKKSDEYKFSAVGDSGGEKTVVETVTKKTK
jgi:hypothetical protein